LINGGSAFSTPIDLNTLFPSGNKVLMPVVSTSGNGVTIGAYVINASKVSDYYIINSSDNGNTWSAPVKLSSASTTFNSSSNATKWFGDYSNSVRTDTKVYNIWSDGRGTGGPKMYVNVTTLWPVAVTDVTPINSSLQLQSVYPNPVASELNLQFLLAKENHISISVYTMEGKQILDQKKSLHAGKQIESLPFESFAPGQYVLKIVDQDGFEIVRHIEKK
jgi:hypothetical protein